MKESAPFPHPSPSASYPPPQDLLQATSRSTTTTAKLRPNGATSSTSSKAFPPTTSSSPPPLSGYQDVQHYALRSSTQLRIWGYNVHLIPAVPTDRLESSTTFRGHPLKNHALSL